MIRTLILFISLCLAVWPAYCSSAKAAAKTKAGVEPQLPLPEAPVNLTGFPNYCIFGAQSGKTYKSEAAFKSVIWRNDVIYVGETHTELKDHLAQLETIKALKIAKGTKIAVAFEMVNSQAQAALDDYAAGKITEENFLTLSDWKKEWGIDFLLYKPLFDYIIQSKFKALALNAPKSVISKIGKGGLASLSAEERALFPENLTVTTHKKYLAYLKTAYEAHTSTNMPNISWENFVVSMSARNEIMGAKIAEFATANPGWSVVVITGTGHVIYNAAVPASVKSRAKELRQASFYLEQAQTCPETFPKEDKDKANYLWYLNHNTETVAPPTGTKPIFR